MRNFIGVSIAALLACGLAGCGSGKIDVTRASSLPAVGGTPFTVVLTKDEERDPEFRHYAGVLAQQLQAHGLVPVRDPAQARYAVMLFQDGPDPLQGYDSTALPVSSTDPGGNSSFDNVGGLPGGSIGGIGGAGLGMGGASGAGGLGGGGGRPVSWGGSGRETASNGSAQSWSEDAPSIFRIAIFDLTRPQSPQEKVFDAEVSAPAKQAANNAVVTAMMAAAFKDLPGRAQEDYSVPLPKVKPRHNS